MTVLRAKLDTITAVIDQNYRDLTGKDHTPQLAVNWADQLTAGLKDDLRNLGVNPDSNTETSAACAGIILLVAMWEHLGYTYTIEQAYSMVRVCDLLLGMQPAPTC